VEASADFYLTLGVEPDADGATIRAAYRNLMRRYHPDVNQSEDAAAKATAINQAYACLRDEDRRAAYDGSRRPEKARPATAAQRPATRRNAEFTPRSFAPVAELHPPPTRWKVVSLGLALLVTIITFTLTSATPPPVPPPPASVDMGGAQSASAAR
jgi:curved DNA-binding protein CbpA